MKKILWLKRPLYANWYVTTKCNLRCTHCYLTDYTKETPRNLAFSIIDELQAMGVAGVYLLGGEPLAMSNLDDIIRYISSKKISPSIATNGILATKDRIKLLVAAGCTQYQVSLEGHSPELSDAVRGRETFEKILNGVDAIKSSGGRVILNLTISKRNYTQVEEMLRMARSVGVDLMRFSAFIPVGTGDLNQALYKLNREIILHVREVLEKSLSAGPPIDSIFLHKEKHQSQTLGCGAATHSFTINADLSLSPCDIDIERERTKPMSDPREMKDLWMNSAVFKKWRGESSDPLFKEVHQHHCHLAYINYRQDLFR